METAACAGFHKYLTKIENVKLIAFFNANAIMNSLSGLQAAEEPGGF